MRKLKEHVGKIFEEDPILSQVEGRNPVLELLKSTIDIRLIQVAQDLEKEKTIHEILRLARDRHTPYRFVLKEQLRKLSKTGLDQGVIAFISPPNYVSLNDILVKNTGKVFVVILDEIQDPQNLGSILRSAEATGVNIVVIPKRASVGITPTVHRASMGGSTYIPVARENLYSAIKQLKKEGIKCVAIDSSGMTDYFEANLAGSLAIVLGGEEKGINPTLLGKCDQIIRIPMLGQLTSLNVGVAAALIMYERVRQNKLGEKN